MIPVYRLISRLANHQRREFEKLSFPEKYSAAQGRVLHYLLNHSSENICQKDIETEFGIRPPSASALLRSMEQNGLICRVSSKEDARVKYIQPTDKAFSYSVEINENMSCLENRILADVSHEDYEIWKKVTLQFMKNLDQKENTK